MKILVLGSEGFIGKNCIKKFLKLGHIVYGVDLVNILTPSYLYYNISNDNTSLDNIFKSNKFDICIHAAGSGNVPLSIEKPQIDFNANVVDTFTLVETIRKFNKECKIIHFSSAAVYGNPKSLPVSETQETIPISPYGWHKLISETILKEYYQLYGINSIILRPFSVYGPGLRKQLIWDIFQKTKLSNTIQLYGTGNETRDFIYIEDLLDLICLILDKYEFEIINAASGIETSILQITDIINKITKSNYTFKFNNIIKQGDPLHWKADISKIKSIGFENKHNLEKGLSETINWIINEA